MPAVESGLRNTRIEWAEGPNATDGDELPAHEAAWNLYSDRVRSFEWGTDTGVEENRGLGEADPEHEKGPEGGTFTVVYDLQQALQSSGTPNDAAGYGIMRDSDNYLYAHHTVNARQEIGEVVENETVDGGNGSRRARIYTVAVGAYVDEVVLTGDPGSQQPITVEITYECVRIRSYQIDQPGGSALDLVSSSANDTSQTVTIEDDSGTTEQVSLNGTNTVTTAKTDWSSIDAIYVEDGSGNPTEFEGTISVSISGGATLAQIEGTDSYDGQDYDEGVPITGSAGSHASAFNSSYEKFIGDTIERPASTSLAYDINSLELTVSNNTERTVREDTFGQRVHVGPRDSEVTATVVGPVESHSSVMESLQVNKNNLVWTLTDSTITISDSVLSDPGSRAPDAGQAAMTLDNTFTGEGVSVS